MDQGALIEVVKQFMMSRHSYNFHVGLSNCMEMQMEGIRLVSNRSGTLVEPQA